ncbi:MAG: M20/M25/M40 family metallo-hydrolase [Solirubrobacteraceae bacterium]|nr:M20/M25/M40 family metallo-hydrolase [Solirubrobacteraceae bacterium]
MTTSQAPADQALEAHAVELLERLVRHDTVNPPGNERAAQEELAADLQEAGFEVTLVGRTEERPNLVARLRGHADGPVLGLLSHVDTVPAKPHEWRHDPWCGEVIDGELWGRGAVDMKSQTAAEVAAGLALAREGWRPARGDLLIISVVDEEVGGTDGAIWICEHHPDLVRCDYLLNEGAGALMPSGDERLYGVCVAEKGVHRFRISTRGTAGHASNPRLGDNALLKLAPLIARLGERQPPYDVTEGPARFLAELGLDPADPEGAVATLRERDPLLALLVEPALGITFAPTMAAGSGSINVIPSDAHVDVDCRTPPGVGEERVRERIAEALGPDGYEVEILERVVGNASPVDTPLMDVLRGWVEREDPGARAVPVVLPAFTDSRTFRAAFPDCVAYGFFPMPNSTLYEVWPRIHAPDERVDVRDVGAAARCYRDVARELLG